MTCGKYDAAMSTKEYLTMTEAAKLLGISRQRIHQIVAAKKITTEQPSPRLRLISVAEFERLKKIRRSAADHA